MPNIDYQNGLIYKIVSKDKSKKECYVGSTTNFDQRQRCHKTRSKTRNQKVYQYIRDNGGWDRFRMVLIEEYPCDTRKELRDREREFVEDMGSLNQVIPGRTARERGKPQYKEYKKEWYQANKERLNQKQRERRQANKA